MNFHESRIFVTAYGSSDIGLVRQNNEDSFLAADLTSGNVNPDSGNFVHELGDKGVLFLVADGMGGANAGEVASKMAVDLIAHEVLGELETARSVDDHAFVRILKRAIENANIAILQESRRNHNRKGMGTTLTMAALLGKAVYFAQLGDTRAYLVRNGSMAQMTKDQSLIAQLVASGTITPEEAKRHPQRNVILQALGVQDHVDVALSSAELKRGDQLILCSDGLSGKVDPSETREIINECSDPEVACTRLIALARDRGGEDNITAVVVRVDGEGLPDPDSEAAPEYRNFELTEKKRRFWFRLGKRKK